MKTSHTKTIGTFSTEQTATDFKNSVLLVSMLANLVVLTSWLVLKVS